MSAPIYELSAERLEGGVQSLGDYAGKVLLIVNTASNCGFTPQYEALEKLRALYVQALPALVVIEDLLGVPPEEQCVRRERLEAGQGKVADQAEVSSLAKPSMKMTLAPARNSSSVGSPAEKSPSTWVAISSGGRVASNQKLYIVAQRIAFAFCGGAKAGASQLISSPIVVTGQSVVS